MAGLASRKSGVRTRDCIQSAWLHLDHALAEDTSLPARGAPALSNLEPAFQSGESGGDTTSDAPSSSAGLKALPEGRKRRELRKRLLRNI